MTVNQQRLADSAAAGSAWRSWAPVLLSLAIVVAVFSLVFLREIVGAVKVWYGSTAYNHCFLVLPLAAVLLWERRDVIAAARPSPTLWVLAVVPVLVAIWSMAALLDILEAAQLTVVALFEVIVLAVLGWRTFRLLATPLLFLFFLVPFGGFLVPALQDFTAVFTARGLELLGIPVFVDGIIIQIPEGTFEVAEACAGLRFLIASIVFGCFYATITYSSKVRRLAFIVLSILVPIIANGFRALGLVVLAHIEGSAAAALSDHILYGWIFFTLVMLLLIAIGLTFAERPRDDAASAAGILPAASSSQGRIWATTSTGLLLVVLGPLFLLLEARASAGPLPPVAYGPSAGSVWVRETGAPLDWRPEAHGADRVSTATYRDGEATVTEFIALYRLPMRGSPLTRSANTVVEPEPWRRVDGGRVAASLGDTIATLNTAKIVHERRQRLVWWFYLVDGEVTGSILKARLLQARTALRGGAHVGALIAISTDVGATAYEQAHLARFLKSMNASPGVPTRRTAG